VVTGLKLGEVGSSNSLKDAFTPSIWLRNFAQVKMPQIPVLNSGAFSG